MGVFGQNFSEDIVFALNKGSQGAVRVACKDGFDLDESGNCVPSASFLALSEGFSSSESASGESPGSLCIERDKFDPAVFDILLEFDSLVECESSDDEVAGYCCKVNHTFTLMGGVSMEDEWWASYGITVDMVWPAGPDQKCLDGRDCQVYLDSVISVTTAGQCEARRILGGYPLALTQEQLDGDYPLADLTFTPLGTVGDLWKTRVDPEEICPFTPTLRPVVSGSSSSSDSSCNVVECGCDPDFEPCYFLDCGMVPNGVFVVDCGLCECVEVSALSSSSSSVSLGSSSSSVSLSSSSSSVSLSSSSSVSSVPSPPSSVSSVIPGGGSEDGSTGVSLSGFMCVRLRSAGVLSGLELPELGTLVPTYRQSAVLSGCVVAQPGEMTNNTVYDSSYPIYQTMVNSIGGVAWVRADYGRVGTFRRVRVGPPPCHSPGGASFSGAVNGNALLGGGGCDGAFYLGASVQYSLDGVQWFDLGQTTEAAFLNSEKTLVGTELIGDDGIKEARYIRIFGGGSLNLAVSELHAALLDEESSPVLDGEFFCVLVDDFDSDQFEYVSGPYSDSWSCSDVCGVSSLSSSSSSSV